MNSPTFLSYKLSRMAHARGFNEPVSAIYLPRFQWFGLLSPAQELWCYDKEEVVENPRASPQQVMDWLWERHLILVSAYCVTSITPGDAFFNTRDTEKSERKWWVASEFPTPVSRGGFTYQTEAIEFALTRVRTR